MLFSAEQSLCEIIHIYWHCITRNIISHAVLCGVTQMCETFIINKILNTIKSDHFNEYLKDNLMLLVFYGYVLQLSFCNTVNNALHFTTVLNF